MSTVHLFVYGTLQPGEYNYPWIQSAVQANPRKGKIGGKLYHVHPKQRVYPVAKLDEEGVIHGTVLTVSDTSRAYRQTKEMEEGAGYRAMTVPCVLAGGDEIDVVAFHYLHDPWGPEIASGDWLAEDAELV